MRSMTSCYTYFESDLFYFMILYILFILRFHSPTLEETRTILFQI